MRETGAPCLPSFPGPIQDLARGCHFFWHIHNGLVVLGFVLERALEILSSMRTPRCRGNISRITLRSAMSAIDCEYRKTFSSINEILAR
jgi:hypothetical protein